MTVTIQAIMTKTLPDPDDPVTALVDCTNHGGNLSIDGLWCLGGDFNCYRVAPPSKGRKPKGNPTSP